MVASFLHLTWDRRWYITVKVLPCGLDSHRWLLCFAITTTLAFDPSYWCTDMADRFWMRLKPRTLISMHYHFFFSFGCGSDVGGSLVQASALAFLSHRIILVSFQYPMYCFMYSPLWFISCWCKLYLKRSPLVYHSPLPLNGDGPFLYHHPSKFLTCFSLHGLDLVAYLRKHPHSILGFILVYPLWWLKLMVSGLDLVFHSHIH